MSCCHIQGYITSKEDVPVEVQIAIRAKKNKSNMKVLRCFKSRTYVRLFNLGPFLEGQPDTQTAVYSAECWN